MPKTEVKSVREMKRLDRWMAYFSNKLTEKEMEELAMSEAAIQEALHAESLFMQSDIERRKYEQREKAIRDYESDMHSSREDGIQEGMHKGRLEERMVLAAEMLGESMPYEAVARITKLSIDQLQELARKNHLL